MKIIDFYRHCERREAISPLLSEIASGLPPLKPGEVIAILENIDHTTGSHYIMRHPDRPQRIPVPYHAKDIKRGVLHR